MPQNMTQQIPMTEEEEKKYLEFEKMLEKNDSDSTTVIPILQQAQHMFGYLPEKVLKKTAEYFGKSYSEVAGIVSFYSFFSTVPKGKYVVRVCMGTACYVRGGKEVLKALQEHLGIDVGQTTEDRQFSLEIGRCFGACGLAPVIMVNDDTFQRIKPAKIPAIIEGFKSENTEKEGTYDQ